MLLCQNGKLNSVLYFCTRNIPTNSNFILSLESYIQKNSELMVSDLKKKMIEYSLICVKNPFLRLKSGHVEIHLAGPSLNKL